MAFEQIVAQAGADRRQGQQEIQNIFQQFGAGVEQGRKQRVLDDAALNVAEGELAALSQTEGFDPSVIEQFTNARNTADKLAIHSRAKAEFGLMQQFAQQEQAAALAQANIGLTGARTGQAEATTEATEVQTSMAPAEHELKVTAAADKRKASEMTHEIAGQNLEIAREKLRQATSPEAKREQELKIKQAEANLSETLRKGSKARSDAKAARSKVLGNAVETYQRTGDTVKAIDDIIDLINGQGHIKATGWQGETMRMLGKVLPLAQTDAGRLGKFVKTVQADAAFSELRKLKESGATLGSVSEKELDLLENAIAALSPDLGAEDFVAQLNKIKTIRARAISKTVAHLQNQGIEIPALLQGGQQSQPETQAAPSSASNPIDLSQMSPSEQQAAFDSLDKDAFFINPSDGSIRQK